MHLLYLLLMFLALLGRYYGNDCIVRYTRAMDDHIKPGDLIIIGGNYALVLGDNVVRWCEYDLNEISRHLAESSLLSPHTMEMIHRMVHERYSSYRKVLALRLTNDIESLLKRKPQAPSSSSASWPHLIASWSSWTRSDNKKDGQQCLIFPDLWTIYSTMPESIKKHKDIIICASSMTEKQRNEARRAIKNDKKRIILSTPATFFHDWYQLTDIHIIDPHLRYYKNRQNPRYNVSSIVKKYIVYHTQ